VEEAAVAIDLDNLEEFVSIERGEVDRRIFSDDEIFEQEMELIFGRAWLFVAHESQIKKAGDFVEAAMGRDNVLIVRQKDGSIKGLLNTCMHRGNAVCRAEEGNTKNFMCTYHGWTYDLAGNLVGVPGLQQYYKDDLDKSALGLREVAQLDTYRGFVFATMDPTAPPLTEYLGATSRLAIDLVSQRGDLEIVPGIQKFVIDCNWKFAVDNLFDWYHPQITHMSANGLLGVDTSAQDEASMVDSGGATTPDGTDINTAAGNPSETLDAIVIVGEYGHAIGGPSRIGIERFLKGPMAAVFNQEWRDTEDSKKVLGETGVRVAGHPNIFPNTWITNYQFSVRIQRSPGVTEIWWYTFLPKEMSDEHRTMAVFMANHVFGPAGMLEQEDGENWSQSTMQTHGFVSKQIPQVLKMNLGKGKIIKEHGLARIDGTVTEHAQMWTYHAWSKWMTGRDWEWIKEQTTPGDYL
jgi:3-phenylpropionate/trans-cinnamate dioxygenase alpha subunit